MVIDAATIGAILAGLTAVIGALGAMGGTIAVRLSRTSREQRREIRELRLRSLLAERYIFSLAQAIIRSGLPMPDPPPGLFDEEYDEPPDDRTTAEAPRGRHRA